jgi:hypothetical protein
MTRTPRTRRAAGTLALKGANPRGATVVTPVACVGERSTVKVRHVVVVRDGRAVNETWQVGPALAL